MISASPLQPAHGQWRLNFSSGMNVSLPSSHLMASSAPITCMSTGLISCASFPVNFLQPVRHSPGEWPPIQFLLHFLAGGATPFAAVFGRFVEPRKHAVREALGVHF